MRNDINLHFHIDVPTNGEIEPVVLIHFISEEAERGSKINWLV